MSNEQNEFKGWEELPNETEKVLGESFWKDFQKIMPKKVPPIDLVENETTGFIYIELPGILTQKDVSLSFQGQHLIVEGHIPSPYQNKQILHSERYIGHFKRSIIIPFSFQANQIQATYENGIFSITIPKTNHSYNVQINIPPK